ncbi:hypothetical protein V8J88_19650 [Massilia sp. W12]|uniref:hypothetical protein n=1 Tax=Massilia sp. W12 TaxID=3126507 RepID=UPI0030D3EE99
MSAVSEEWERRETSEELAVVIRLAQEMTQRLAAETHGEMFAEVGELGILLRKARDKVEYISAHA